MSRILHDALRSGGPVIEGTFDFVHEFGRIAWLDEHDVEARRARFREFLALRKSRCRDQRDECRRLAAAQAAGGLATGDPRQIEVENDQVGQFVIRNFHGHQAVTRGQHIVATGTQIRPPHIEGVTIIINKKDSGGNHGGSSTPFHSNIHAKAGSLSQYDGHRPRRGLQ